MSISIKVQDSNFNQDISKWNISNVEEYQNIFEGCSIKESYKHLINTFSNKFKKKYYIL